MTARVAWRAIGSISVIFLHKMYWYRISIQKVVSVHHYGIRICVYVCVCVHTHACIGEFVCESVLCFIQFACEICRHVYDV